MARLGESFGIHTKSCTYDRQLVAADEPLPQSFLPGLVLKVLVGLVVELLMSLEKSTIASSSESVKQMFKCFVSFSLWLVVACSWLVRLRCLQFCGEDMETSSLYRKYPSQVRDVYDRPVSFQV